MALLLERLRAKAVAWINNANIDDLGKLPEEVLFGESPAEHARSTEMSIGSRRKRIPRKVRRPMTRHEAEEVRRVLSGMAKESVEYLRTRDSFAREHGFTLRQIGAAVAGPSVTAAKSAKTTARREAISGGTPPPGRSIGSHIEATRKRRQQSAAQRKAVSLRMKKYWAERRKAKK